MKKFTLMLAVIALSAVVGCSSFNKKASSSSETSTAAVRSTTPPPPPPPMIQPVQPAQPIQPVSDAPVTVTPVVSTTPIVASTTGGTTYTVQKGDTLYKIARAKYNDPSAVKKIKEANPGMNPDQIKVGQKITLP